MFDVLSFFFFCSIAPHSDHVPAVRHTYIHTHTVIMKSTNLSCRIVSCLASCWHWNTNSTENHKQSELESAALRRHSSCLERLWTPNCALTSSLPPVDWEDYWRQTSESFRLHLKSPCTCSLQWYFCACKTFTNVSAACVGRASRNIEDDSHF